MKRTQWQFILILTVMLTAFNMNMMADKRIVERGMSKQEVIAILGKPQSTSFNQYGEQWEYMKVGIINYDHRIIIHFDRNNKVISYRDIELRPGKAPDQQVIPVPVPPYDGYPDMGRPYPGYPDRGYYLSEHDFSIIYKRVKEASFDDNKMALIEVASLGCYFTCAQCAQLINMFSFSDKQLKALRMMAPRIVDPHNGYTIYQVFRFSSDKDEAARILQRSYY
ncbi:DUF4476 domain-containing protein [Prevotella sp. A2931]|uniref:DUF4476 domain-containing protein n=1 Tax=Prevotella illustrans TaxID=2800387 RepID=A0ABS3M5P5_9BACT|nr:MULTISPECIES: DUF4476 domain-containing protein [Prevotella]MBO1363406.1 DUF4476 domain-containing protein [Prevotella illustrans]PTL26113.1 hypothetical protein C3V39_02955 [Prevotella sp. oral taxon 820]